MLPLLGTSSQGGFQDLLAALGSFRNLYHLRTVGLSLTASHAISLEGMGHVMRPVNIVQHCLDRPNVEYASLTRNRGSGLVIASVREFEQRVEKRGDQLDMASRIGDRS
jgi:hypothetical protein